MFARWGHFIYRFRWMTLLASIPFLALSVAAFVVGVSPNYNGEPPVEAGRAEALLIKELPHSGFSFTLVFASSSQTTGDPAFRSAVQAALAPLTRDPRVTTIETPYNTPQAARQMESTDRHMALAVVSVKGDFATSQRIYPTLRARVRSSSLRIYTTGDMALNHDFTTYLNGDLARTSGVVLPIALILLLLVFGTVIAALLPLGVAALALVAGLASVFLLGRITDITQYALNLVALIGLGVAIDYSLFIANRFREELAAGRNVDESVTTAIATAGRAVVFSGLTVAIGLSGMFFYQGVYLATMGLAGAVGVALAVLCAITFLPALLSVLGPRVNRLRVPMAGSRPDREGGFWHGLATGVMRRPIVALLPAVAFLLVVGWPILSIQLANSDIRALPPQAPSRTALDLIVSHFPGQNQNTIHVVVNFPGGHPLSAQHAGYLYDLSHRISALPGVLRVKSPVDSLAGMSRSAVIAQLGKPAAQQPPSLRGVFAQYVGKHIVDLDVLARAAPQSDLARSLVRAIRALPQPAGGELMVTGQTAFDIDAIDYIQGRTPLAVGYIMLITYVILFLLVGSVVLPLKAVVMNLVSVAASFGILVWIFQQGHLHTQLNFTPQQLDPTTLVLLFCIVFGLSMDYEVFLLTRIQEEYRRTGNTSLAVAVGLERSGRLITGAAAIMIGVFLAFGGLANTVIIKEIGLGLAIAVAIDATIVRGLVVPALMRILGKVNWWAPAPLERFHERLGLTEQTRPAAIESPAREPAVTGQ